MKSTCIAVLFSLFVPCAVSAWDFCCENADGLMLYYNYVDESSCEVTWGNECDWDYPVIRIPGEVTVPAGQRRDEADTLLAVIGIGEAAFSTQHSPTPYMRRVVFSYGLGYIGKLAFAGCDHLKSVEWPEDNEWFYSIGERAFVGCRELNKFTMPRNTEILGVGAFASSGVKELKFEAGNTSLTEIPSNCFYEAGLESLDLPANIKVIGDGAFRNCRGLSRVVLRGVRIIGEYAFYNHQLWKEFELPETVTDIGDYAFCCMVSENGAPPRNLMHVNTLYVNAKTPPYCTSTKTLGDDTYKSSTKTFTPVIDNIIFVVPLKTAEAYRTTYPWSRIAEICYRQRDTSGVSAVESLTEREECFFGMDGIMTSQARPGVNIVRYKNGTVRKILKK